MRKQETGNGEQSVTPKTRSHRDLIVWQKAMDLTALIYVLTEKLPKSEAFGLSSQMQRAAISIAANIAEGNARGSRKDYARFIAISRGSAVELETLIEVAVRVGRFDAATVAPVLKLTDEVCRMLFSLRSKLEMIEDFE